MPKSSVARPAARSDTGPATTPEINQDVNIEAVIKANEALASGAAALGQEIMEFASKMADELQHDLQQFVWNAMWKECKMMTRDMTVRIANRSTANS